MLHEWLISSRSGELPDFLSGRPRLCRLFDTVRSFGLQKGPPAVRRGEPSSKADENPRGETTENPQQ